MPILTNFQRLFPVFLCLFLIPLESLIGLWRACRVFLLLLFYFFFKQQQDLVQELHSVAMDLGNFLKVLQTVLGWLLICDEWWVRDLSLVSIKMGALS